jgi:hypothetical protein
LIPNQAEHRFGSLGDVATDIRIGKESITLKVYAHLFRSKDGKATDAINTALANLGDP